MTACVLFMRNPLRGSGSRGVAPSQAPLAFHRSLPDFAATPLKAVPALSHAWGCGSVWLKLETERLGLPSYKILGAAWAAHRLLCDRVGLPADETPFAQLRDMVRGQDLGFVTASAGNWGRAMARVARLLSLRAVVVVPADTAPSRIQAIESEGATVEQVRGNFDEAVRAGGERVTEQDLLLADTASRWMRCASGIVTTNS